MRVNALCLLACVRVPGCAFRFLTCARSLTWLTSLTSPLYRVRPECSVDFTAEQKLYGVLFVPISCCIGVFLANVFTVLISLSRIHRKMINTCPQNMMVHITGGVCTLLHCLLASSFGIHLKRDTIAQHGPLYYALNPRLFERASWDVGLTRTRFQRRNQESGGDDSKKRAVYPQAWLLLRSFFEVSGIDHDFINDTMTLKKSASGALSVLVLSYVGVIETALPILDCFQSTQSDGTSKYFLRSDRNIECSSHSAQYRSLVSMAVIGLAVYGVAIPALFQLVVWSKWGCRFYRLEFAAFHVSSSSPRPPPAWPAPFFRALQQCQTPCEPPPPLLLTVADFCLYPSFAGKCTFQYRTECRSRLRFRLGGATPQR